MGAARALAGASVQNQPSAAGLRQDPAPRQFWDAFTVYF